MGIFKAYDIRGHYPDELNESMAYAIGSAFVTLTKAKDVLVGRDSRTHSPALSAAFIRGATDAGANVTDAGLCTTPQVIAMHRWKGHETAVMVTASHLEAPFNGFKLYRQGGVPLNMRNGMQELEKLTAKPAPKGKKGAVRDVDYTKEYAQRIEELSPTKSNLLFIVDCSNGSVGPEMLLHRRQLGLNLQLINNVPDGTFPHHSPDPLAANAQKYIGELIVEKGAAGGCVFDADADRVVFFDEHGRFIKTNFITCLLVQELLKKNPGRVIAYDLISSKIVPETIEASGGKPLRTVVGRNLLVDDMREQNALFGAEVSSHMVYQELAYADASTHSMLLVLDILTRSGKPFSQLVKPFAKYASYERNYHVPQPDSTLLAIEAAFPESERDYLDGITFVFPDSWLVIRKSNTEPLLRVRGEGDTQQAIQARVHTAEKVIFQQGGTIAYH